MSWLMIRCLAMGRETLVIRAHLSFRITRVICAEKNGVIHEDSNAREHGVFFSFMAVKRASLSTSDPFMRLPELHLKLADDLLQRAAVPASS